MKRALYIIKSVIICVCTGIVLGFFVMLGVWAFSKDKPDAMKCLNILRTASAAGAVTAAAVKLIYSLIDLHPVNKALKIAEQQDDPQKAYDLMERKAERTQSPSKKAAYMLILSAVYTETENYAKALETLEKIDFSELSPNLQQEYFNAFMYTYLQNGDLKNAEKVYSEAEPYFSRPAPSVLHTLGVFEYAKGNYGKARSYLLQSRSADGSDRNICDCDLYLALCSLKEGSLRDAKALADEAESTLSTKCEERNLTKLRALIEKYESMKESRPAPEEDTAEIQGSEPQAEEAGPLQTEENTETENTEQDTQERTT